MYTEDVIFNKYTFQNKTLYADNDYINSARELFYENIKILDIIKKNYNQSSTTYNKSIWNKDIENKTFLIIDTEYKHKVYNSDYYSLVAAIYFEVNSGDYNIYKTYHKILNYSPQANETIYEKNSIIEFEYLKHKIIDVDYLVMHQSAADVPRISKIFNLDKQYLYNKTIDTYYSTKMVFNKLSHGKNFYSLANIYNNLLLNKVVVSPCHTYLIFGGPIGHLFEIKLSHFEYIIDSKKFKEHHPLFDSILTFLVFLEYLSLYHNFPYRVFHYEEVKY